jgi:hypothetical protein
VAVYYAFDLLDGEDLTVLMVAEALVGLRTIAQRRQRVARCTILPIVRAASVMSWASDASR